MAYHSETFPSWAPAPPWSPSFNSESMHHQHPSELQNCMRCYPTPCFCNFEMGLLSPQLPMSYGWQDLQPISRDYTAPDTPSASSRMETQPWMSESPGDQIPNELAGDQSQEIVSAQVSWTGPTQCPLTGCRSRHVIRSPKSLRMHFKTVHGVKVLRCTEPLCTHDKAFANKTDLRRHRAAKHSKERPYKCKVATCTRPVKEWSRVDKLQDHNRKFHPNPEC